ncbi:MAG: TRAP transporter small permease [Alphaproteobacteria bacterium]
MAENRVSADTESTLPGILGAIDAWVGHMEAFMLAAGVLLMAANTVANVVGRFLLGKSIFFTEELNSILIILITFAGISYAARHGRHIRMSAIYDALPDGARKTLMVAICAITALAMFALTYFAISYIMQVATSGRVLPALQIPVYWTFLWVPIGFFFTGLQYALTAIRNLTSGDIYLSTKVQEGYEEQDIEA